MVRPKRKKQVLEDEIAEQCPRGKRFSSPAPPLHLPPPSFFKIMVGQFTEVLFIPPKFTYNLIGHANQNIYLKDCNEQSSKVKVSRIDGLLAFQEGWPKFVADHSINVGELLVFTNVARALFSVKIFDIGGCERVSFGEGSNREACTKNIVKTLSLESSQFPRSYNVIEASKDEYGASRKDPEIINDLKDCNEQSSKVKVSRIDGLLAFQEGWPKFVADHSINVGELLVFTNVARALFSVKIFDIGACERVSFGEGSNREACTKNIIKTLSLESSQFPRSYNVIEASKDEYGASRKDSEIINDLSNSCIEIIIAQANDKGISESGNEVQNFLQRSHDSASSHNTEAIDVTELLTNIASGQAAEKYEDRGCSLPSVTNEKDNVMHASGENIGGFGSALHDKSFLDTKGKTCQSVHDTLPEEDQQVDSCCQRNQNPEAAKIEAVSNVKASFLPDCFCFSLTLPSNNWCCLVLPQRLPLNGHRKNYGQRVVILQDPSQRSWPIIYQANNKFTGFLSGWKNFAISNKLQQGNQCEFFVVPNEIETVFQVKIIRP